VRLMVVNSKRLKGLPSADFGLLARLHDCLL
jgi:hypothetical protein